MNAAATARSLPNHVPMADWGKDHWSLLAYVEARCVDDKGFLDHRRMRANPDKHPTKAHAPAEFPWKPENGTRLAGYFLPDAENGAQRRDENRRLPEHDDWDCLEDLESEGLVDLASYANSFVILTAKGRDYANRLRAFKCAGGNFAEFVA